MLALLLIIQVATYGFTGASEECETPVYQYCEIHDYNFDAPTTKNDLVTFCKNGKRALQCAISLLTKCKANEDDLSKLLEIQSNAEALCDENNVIYQVVYENIECIGSALTTAYFGCPQSVEKGVETVFAEKAITFEFEEETGCPSSLFLLSCHVIHTRQLCGRMPAEATLEIFRIFHFPIQCKPEIAAELPTIVETIELIEQEEIELENAFSKR